MQDTQLIECGEFLGIFGAAFEVWQGDTEEKVMEMRKTKNMKKVAAVLLAASVSVNLLSLTSLADQTGYDTQSESDTTDDSSADADTDADSSSDSEDTTSEETSGEETSSEDTSASGEDTSEGAGEDQGNEDGSTIVSQTSESETTNADLGDVSPSQDVTLEMTPGSTTTVTQNVVVDLEEIANNNMEIPEELKNGAESASRPITDEAGNEIGTETFTPVYATDGTTVSATMW
jgi:cobalamin biosynthesis protein CobT